MSVESLDNDDDDLYSNPSTDTNYTIISSLGDLLITLYDHGKMLTYKYRVEADRLRQGSPYFASLLHPEKFAEGSRVCREIKELRIKYNSAEEMPTAELPRVVITDVGRISEVRSIKVLAADFFRVLHGQELSTANPPISNLANLAIVADRFDALALLARYVRKRRFLQSLDAKTNRGTSSNLPEERIRQKLLIGLLLDHGTWVSMYSKRLIIKNSIRWKPETLEEHDSALFWDLPHGLEGMHVKLAGRQFRR
jgi:hypothetical protein